MTFSKKIISFILAIVICFTMAPMAFAADKSKDDKIVANFYVFIMETKIHPIGHTWVYLENLTNKPMQVGYYTVPAYEGVSIGVFARKDGFGIYYNVEAYCQGAYGAKNQLSMSDTLTAQEVKNVSDTLIDASNHWDPIFNCMYFCFKIWNSGCSPEKRLLHLVWPPFGKIQMLLKDHEYGVSMKSVKKDKTFRQVGSGSRGYLKPATDKSLGPI